MNLNFEKEEPLINWYEDFDDDLVMKELKPHAFFIEKDGAYYTNVPLSLLDEIMLNEDTVANLSDLRAAISKMYREQLDSNDIFIKVNIIYIRSTRKFKISSVQFDIQSSLDERVIIQGIVIDCMLENFDYIGPANIVTTFGLVTFTLN